MNDRRYEISTFIGPCAEKDADALCEAILDLPEFAAVGGGGVSRTDVLDGDPAFTDVAGLAAGDTAT